MWKAAFSGRSESGSVSGRPSSQRKKSSGSVVSSTSRDERRKSGKSSRGSTYDDYEDDNGGYVPATPSSRAGEPRGLTESAVNALNKDDDLDWEDEDKDARSERRSVKSGKSGRSERHRRKSERSRSRSREKGRKEERKKSSRRDSDRGDTGREDVYGRQEGDRAMPEMGSFEQFPGQYADGMMGQAGQADHMMSGGLSERPPQAPDQQFGPTREDSFGAAAGYYLDEGQSVANQPGVRKSSPNMLVNPEHHLHAASAEAQPAQDTGQGLAADFFTGDIPLTAEPQPISKPGKKPASSSSSSKPSKPSKTSSLGTAAAATAALGSAAVAGSSSYPGTQQYSNGSSSSRPGRKGSEQVSPGSTTPQYPPPQSGQGVNGNYYAWTSGQGAAVKQGENASYYSTQSGQATPTRPTANGSYYVPATGRQNEGKVGKQSSQQSNAGTYAAGVATAGFAGYAAHEAHQSQQQKYSQSHYGTTQYPGFAQSAAYTSGSYAGTQQQPFHEHKGPITKVKDGFLNLLSTEEDVVKMEMYTEAIGVCKYCFDPRTSPWDAPRRHHYHKHGSRRDSFEDLRSRRSLDKMRRRASREQLDGRVDKDSRYYASDSKRKSGSKADLAAAGLAGVGLAAGANALFNSGKDFEDTYSVKSGHRASSAARRRSRSSSRERRRKSTHGVLGRDSKDEYVFVRTKDGRTEKRRVQRSRSRSKDGRSSIMGAAAGAALGASAMAAASSRRRNSRSRSRSSSPGLAGILGFSDSKSKRGRHSPDGPSYNITSRPLREEQQSPGLFGGFFTSPSSKRKTSKREHHKKKAGFFNFGNGSSSSSDGEMAFGDGFSSKTNLPLQRQTSSRNVKRRGSDQRLAATIAGIGTTAAALAAAQKGHRVTKRTSRPQLGAKRRHYAQQDPSDEEWEDELPSDASSGSSLAFGDYDNKLSRRQSRESMTSNGSGAGGLSAWGWRWGGKKDREKRRVPSPPPAYPPRPDASIVAPAAAAAGVATVTARDAVRPSYDSRGSSMSGMSQTPMQFVDPKPVSEESGITTPNRISMPGSFDADEPPVIRPGPGPIQQPKPVAPIQPSFTDHQSDDISDRPKPRRTMSSPTQSSFGLKDAAMIGAAAVGTASIIASQSGRRSREPKDVRFGLTEEQQAKEEREKRKEREKVERNERARADRERALKEEAERHTREQDVLRRREEENRKAAEARVERERRDKEADEMRERERQEALRREEARKAEEEQRQEDVKRRREAEIDAEIQAKRREFEEEQLRSQRRRDSQSDRKSERSSSIPWGAVAAGTAAAATASAAYGGAEGEKARDKKDRDAYTAREITPGKASSELADQDIFDPALFTRKRTPNRSPSGDRQIEEIARKAYEKIRDEDGGDYDQMIAEKEDYYHEPQRSQADVFAPRDILDRKAGYKEHAPDPMGGNEVRYVRDAQGHDFDAELYGPTSFERSKHAPHGVPRMGLIAPTPPPDPRVKEKERRRREQSPLSKSDVDAAPEREARRDERDTRAEPGGRARSRSITWGEPQTHVYEPRTPESFREGADGYIDAKNIGAAAAATAAAVAGDVSAYAASHDENDARSSSGMQGSRSRNADVEEVIDAARGDDAGYRKPFFESVSDLGFKVDSPGTEGAPPVRGFVEGELDQTPREERPRHIPGGWDDDQKDGEFFDAEDMPASAAKDAPVAAEESAWEPPLSKKEKKKREKAAKRAATLEEDALPTPPVMEPKPERIEETATPAKEEIPYEMLSKKDKKKRDKAKRASILDEEAATTPAAETEPEPETAPMQEPIAPVEEEIPYEFLSKKDKKKRDKAKRASMLEDEAATPTAAETEPEAAPAEEPIAPIEEEIPYEFLSKKDKKKRDKLKRNMSEDVAVPPPEPETVPEPPPAVEEEIPYEMLSKKDKKKRDKLQRSMSEDIPPEPLNTEPETVVEAEPEPAWGPPLSKKEQKKREKEAKKQGFADVAAAAMTTAGVAAVAGAAAEDENESWDTPSSNKGKKGKKGEPVERDIRDIEPAGSSMPGGWEEDKTGDTTPEAVDPFQYQVPSDSPPAASPAADAAKEVDPMDEFADLKSSKKSKKKAKRDSLRFNEPEVSSPLRSEVPVDDYIGVYQTRSGGEVPTNGHVDDSKLADEPPVQERSSRSEKNEVDDRPLTESPRRISPDDIRSVASEPTGARERRRRSKGDYRASDYYEEGETDPYDDVRSVAASEPADIYERRRSKRRSRAEEDDTASVVSMRSRRDKDDEGKKEKKGGFFGLFGKKSSSPPSKSEGASLSRTSTRESKVGYDDDGERRRRRRRSEYGDDDDDDDIPSGTIESRHRHHHRRRTDEDYPRSDSGSRHSRRRTGDDYFGGNSKNQEDRDQSFLGTRVEDMPPLPANRPTPPLSSVAKSDGQGFGTPGPAEREAADVGEFDAAQQQRVFQGPGETVQAVELRDVEREKALRSLSGNGDGIMEGEQPALGVQQMKVPAVEEAAESLPALPESPPDSPTELKTTQTPHRPVALQRPTSTTAVPLRFPFGQSPSTPGQGRMERAVSFGGHLPSSPSTPHHAPHKTRQGRPASTEMMPLYLVERTRKPAEMETELPSLPSSKPSSRASSIVGSDEYESAIEDSSSRAQERVWERGLSIDIDSANAGFTAAGNEAGEDYLDSQQTTPKATERPSDPFASVKGLKQQPEYWTWQDLQKEQEQAEALAKGKKPQPQFYTWEDYERDEALHRETQKRRIVGEEDDLPALPPSRPESRTERESGSGDLVESVAAGALAGSAAVLGYNALRDREQGGETKREMPTEASSVDPDEISMAPASSTSSKRKKKEKKGKKQLTFDEPQTLGQRAALSAELPRSDTETFVDAEKTMEEGGAAARVPDEEFFPPAKPNALDRFLETEVNLEAGSSTQQPCVGETSRDAVAAAPRLDQDAVLSTPTDAEFFKAEQHAEDGESNREASMRDRTHVHSGSPDGMAAGAIGAVASVSAASMLGENGKAVEDESLVTEPGQDASSHHRSVSGASMHLPHLEKQPSPSHEQEMVAVPAPVEPSTSVDTEARPEGEFASLLSRKQSKKAKKQAKKGGGKTALGALMAVEAVGEGSDHQSSRVTTAEASTAEVSTAEVTDKPSAVDDFSSTAVAAGELVRPKPAQGDAVSALASLSQPEQEATTTQVDAGEEWDTRPSLSHKQNKKQKKQKQKQRLDVFGENEQQQQGSDMQASEAAATIDNNNDVAAFAADTLPDPRSVEPRQPAPEDIPLPEVDDVEFGEGVTRDLEYQGGQEGSRGVVSEIEPVSTFVDDTSANLPMTAETGIEPSITGTEEFVAADDSRFDETLKQVSALPAVDAATGSSWGSLQESTLAQSLPADRMNETSLTDKLATERQVGQEALRAVANESAGAHGPFESVQTPAGEPEDEFAWSTGSKKKAKKGKKAKKVAFQASSWDEGAAADSENQPADTIGSEMKAEARDFATSIPVPDAKDAHRNAEDMKSAENSPGPLEQRLADTQGGAESVLTPALGDEVSERDLEQDIENPAVINEGAPVTAEASTTADGEPVEDFWAFSSSKKKKAKKSKKVAAAPPADEPSFDSNANAAEEGRDAAIESQQEGLADTPEAARNADFAQLENPSVEAEDLWAPASSSKKKKKKGKKGANVEFATPTTEVEPTVDSQADIADASGQGTRVLEGPALVDVSAETQNAPVTTAEADDFWDFSSKKKKKGNKAQQTAFDALAAQERPDSSFRTKDIATDSVDVPSPAVEHSTEETGNVKVEPERVPSVQQADNLWEPFSTKKKKGKKGRQSTADSMSAQDDGMDSREDATETTLKGEGAENVRDTPQTRPLDTALGIEPVSPDGAHYQDLNNPLSFDAAGATGDPSALVSGRREEYVEPALVIDEQESTSRDPPEDTSFGFATKKSKKDKKKARKAAQEQSVDAWADEPQEATEIAPHEASATMDNMDNTMAVPAGALDVGTIAASANDTGAAKAANGGEEEWPTFSTKKSKKDKRKAKKSGGSTPATVTETESTMMSEPMDLDQVPEQGAITGKGTETFRNMQEELATEPSAFQTALSDPAPDTEYAMPGEIADEPAGSNTRYEETDIDTEEQAVRQTSSAIPNQEGDIDFAATLAAGLQDSGFDPNMVVDDPVFHRRATPPGASGEANPEEVFESFSKKKKKAKKGKQAEATSDEPSRDVSGDQTPRNASDDFDNILAISLEGTGIDSSSFERASLPNEEQSSNDLTGDAAEFSLSTAKRKKGKKKGQPTDPQPSHATDEHMADRFDKASAPIDEAAETHAATTHVPQERSETPTLGGEDGNGPSELRPELSRKLTIDTNTTEPSSALTTTPGTPLLDPAADLVHAGDRDMDVDDMDKAYRAYKRNKRKQKKQKWAAIQETESASDAPQAAREKEPLAGALEHSTSREATEAINGQREAESIEQTDFMMATESAGGDRLEGTSIQGYEPRNFLGDYVHTSEVSQSLPKAFERSPSPPARTTAPTEGGQDERSGRSLVHGAEAVGIGAAAAAGVAGAGALLNRSTSRHRDSSAHSPRLGSKRSLGLLPNDNQSSWSFDGLQKGNAEHDDIPNRAMPTIRPAQSKESLHSRRSNEALYISTDTGPEWDLKTPKRRTANTAATEDSHNLHARTPSQTTQDTPLESTSRNRASYLFQTTPENLRGLPSDGEATPVQEPGYFPTEDAERLTEHQRSLDGTDRAALSPPVNAMSPRLPLDTIHEEHSGHKRSMGEVADAPGPDQKAVRRTETPQSIRARERALSPTGLPPLKTTSTSGRSVSNPGVDELARASDLRSSSVLSNRSNGSGNQWKSPDELRSYSRASNRSNTPSLRRTSLSGDLRAASRRGDSGSTVGARSSPKTIPFEAPPTPPSNDDEVMDAGASRSAGMSDVFQGYGDAQGSQVSPTRPPSMRKRQSMHIMDLETKLEQLAAENQALQSAKQDNGSSRGFEDQGMEETLRARDLELHQKDNEIRQIRAMLQPMQDEISRLTEMNDGLTEANRNLVDDSNNRYSTLQQEHAQAHEQWQTASRELDGLKQEHGQLTSGLRAAVEAELATALASKNSEIRELKEELDVATEKIRALQVQIQSTKGRDFLTVRDEDYFDGACQKLCQHVQQWVLRFSKVSDKHMCRMSSDLKDDKFEARLDNAILDGSDVDKLLADRVRRRDVFMSVVMTMVWEYVFTRYLFGMDREQRQKLKGLEKLLSEVGPPRAVAQWRATTLTLLAKRPAFTEQRNRDEEAVGEEIFDLLCALLPPPSTNKEQMRASLFKVIHIAVDLSIEMRTQRSEYIMLPPLLPEYDTNGDLMHKVHFNASLMNERSGMFSSNEELEQTRAVVKIVLFPLVVKKGDESGEGEEEIVVCPAQVLVHNDNGRGKKVVRVESGHMTIDDPRRSRQSLMSAAGSTAF